MLINRILTTLSKKFNIDLHYFAKGGFWMTLTQVIAILGGLATSVVFAHTLSETTYGTYQYILGIGALLTSFSLTGIGQSILQTAAKNYSGFFAVGIKNSFIYSAGITLASVIGSIYYFLNDNSLLAAGCLLIAVFQPLINNFQNISAYLTGKKLFKESTLLQVVKTITVTATSLSVIFFTQNILLLLLAYLATNTLVNFLSYLYFKPKKTELLPYEVENKYLAYAKHTSLRNIIANLAFRIDTILVFTQLGAAELAIYTIANIIPEQIKGSFKNLAALLMPKYVQHKDIVSIRENIPKRSFQLLIILLLLTGLYVCLTPFIYGLLFPKYGDAIFLSQIISLSFPAFILLIPQSALQAQLEEKKLHLLTIQSAVILLALMLVLIPFIGLMGAILAKILSRYFSLSLNYYYLYKK